MVCDGWTEERVKNNGQIEPVGKEGRMELGDGRVVIVRSRHGRKQAGEACWAEWRGEVGT